MAATVSSFSILRIRLGRTSRSSALYSNGPAQVDGVAFPPKNEGHGGYTIDNASGHNGISPLVSSVMPTYAPHIITSDDRHQRRLLPISTWPNAPIRLGNLIDSIYAQLPNVLLIVAQIYSHQRRYHQRAGSKLTMRRSRP